MRVRAAGLSLFAASALACGGGGGPPAKLPPPAPSTDSPGVLTATVAGRKLDLRRAVFLWRERADDLTFALTDVDNPCAAFAQGKWPRGATVLMVTVKHTASDNRDAPFRAGEYPLRQGGAVKPQDTKQATFLGLNEGCAPMVTAKAASGKVTITSPELGTTGSADGAVDLVMSGGEVVKGTFHATYCPPPDEELRGCH